MKVGRINVTPVKGLGLQHPEEVELTAKGVETNRRFYLISGWRLFNGKDHGPLVRIAPSVENGRLRLDFPDGRVIDGEVELGEAVSTNFWGRQVAGRLVVGPWSDALSDYAGASVQLVRTDEPGTGTDVHVGTLVSRASCERLGHELAAEVDARRFRMLFDLDGGEPHEEDTLERVRIGDAVVRIAGPVPRNYELLWERPELRICGETTLAVEMASLIGSRARYQTLDGEQKPVRVLLIDAARSNPACHLRLGVDPATVSRLLSRFEWPDAMTFAGRVVETRFGVSLLPLPQLPLQGLGPEVPFGPMEVDAILEADRWAREYVKANSGRLKA